MILLFIVKVNENVNSLKKCKTLYVITTFLELNMKRFKFNKITNQTSFLTQYQQFKFF